MSSKTFQNCYVGSAPSQEKLNIQSNLFLVLFQLPGSKSNMLLHEAGVKENYNINGEMKAKKGEDKNGWERRKRLDITSKGGSKWIGLKKKQNENTLKTILGKSQINNVWEKKSHSQCLQMVYPPFMQSKKM